MMFAAAYKSLADRVRSNNALTALVWSPRLTQLIWGIPVHRKLVPMTWDLTTLCLKTAIDTSAPSKPFHFLDMGCGHLALLGQYLKKVRPQARVTSVDIYPEFVENARFNACRNGLRIEVRQGDLFESSSERYDLIAFNPPYVPDDGDAAVAYPKTAYSGSDGTDEMRRFLAQAPRWLAPGGRILLGVNAFFVPEQRCQEIIRERGFSVEAIVRRRFNTSRVFVLRRRLD